MKNLENSIKNHIEKLTKAGVNKAILEAYNYINLLKFNEKQIDFLRETIEVKENKELSKDDRLFLAIEYMVSNYIDFSKVVYEYIEKKESCYSKITEERNSRLEKSKDVGDYDFLVAHGLTEAIRIIDGVGFIGRNK